MTDDAKLITPIIKGLRVRVLTPEPLRPKSEPVYSLIIPIQQADAGYIKKLRRVSWDVAKARFGTAVALRDLSLAYQDGDACKDKTLCDDVRGSVYFYAVSPIRPGVIDVDGNELKRHSQVYSGASYRCCIEPYAWGDKKDSRGIGVRLYSLLKVSDGEPLEAISEEPIADDDNDDEVSVVSQDKVKQAEVEESETVSDALEKKLEGLI